MTIEVGNWCEANLAREMTIEQARFIVGLTEEYSGGEDHLAREVCERFPGLAKHAVRPKQMGYHYSCGFIYSDTKTTLMDTYDFGVLLVYVASAIIRDAANAA